MISSFCWSERCWSERYNGENSAAKGRKSFEPGGGGATSCIRLKPFVGSSVVLCLLLRSGRCPELHHQSEVVNDTLLLLNLPIGDVISRHPCHLD